MGRFVEVLGHYHNDLADPGPYRVIINTSVIRSINETSRSVEMGDGFGVLELTEESMQRLLALVDFIPLTTEVSQRARPEA